MEECVLRIAIIDPQSSILKSSILNSYLFQHVQRKMPAAKNGGPIMRPGRRKQATNSWTQSSGAASPTQQTDRSDCQ